MSKGGKSVSFKVPQSKLTADADRWINDRGAEPASDREGGNVTTLKPAEVAAPASAEAPKERMTRFTFDVTESLHRRIKVQCATRGVKMADVVRDFLEREFPAS